MCLSELHQKLRVPIHILNSSIERLCTIGYLNPVKSQKFEDKCTYQPGHPLDSLTLAEFKKTFDCYGNNKAADIVAGIHPCIRIYRNAIFRLNSPAARLNFGNLIAEENDG